MGIEVFLKSVGGKGKLPLLQLNDKQNALFCTYATFPGDRSNHVKSCSV